MRETQHHSVSSGDVDVTSRVRGRFPGNLKQVLRPGTRSIGQGGASNSDIEPTSFTNIGINFGSAPTNPRYLREKRCSSIPHHPYAPRHHLLPHGTKVRLHVRQPVFVPRLATSPRSLARWSW